MKSLLSVLIVIFLVSCTETKKAITEKLGNTEYTLENGRFNGLFTTYYPNGQKQAEGILKDNYRTGNWKAWDSLGNLVVERNYTSPFDFARVLPKVSGDDLPKLMSQPVYSVQNNKEGFKEYFRIQERMIVWSKRLWRYIPKENNEALFQQEVFLSKLANEVKSGTISAFSAEDDEFKTLLKSSDLNFDPSQVIGFKIKEDWFFDNERFVMESRIIGICPVIRNQEKEEDAFWLYYPEIRPLLSSLKFEQKAYSKEVETYDDYFFFRSFSSSVYKENNIYDREISSYKTGEEMKEEARRIELEVYNEEIKNWLYFSGIDVFN